MLELRPFDRLGRFDNDWLHARYHFSFSEYHDPERMGWSALRVWNDDLIEPETGFPTHGHRDMEIITYVREGAISHEDSLGNQGRTEAGQIQVMSAGTGIRHAEANREATPTRLFQIWIMPHEQGLPPRWETRQFARSRNRVEILASGNPDDDGAIPINQDARVLGATLDAGARVEWACAGRKLYLVPARGTVTVNGVSVSERSGLAISGEDRLVIEAESVAEIVAVDTA